MQQRRGEGCSKTFGVGDELDFDFAGKVGRRGLDRSRSVGIMPFGRRLCGDAKGFDKGVRRRG